MDNHRSKTAKIRGYYLAHNTLLGLNELKYSVPIVNVFVYFSHHLERPLALNQPRQSNVFLALQQCKALLIHGVHQISAKFQALNCNNFYCFQMLNIKSYNC